MPKIKKSRQKRDLASRRTFIEDESNNSPFYFNVTKIGEEFNLGKNGFIINGSQNLASGAEVQIEITDSRGDVIYHEIRPYTEGVSRVVGVYVYEDTPVGQGQITILSEAIRQKNGNPVPEDQRGKLNLKWTKDINVNPNEFNTDVIRFVRPPEIIVNDEEYVKKNPNFASPEAATERLGNTEYIPEDVEFDPEFEDNTTFPLLIADDVDVPSVSFKYYPPQWSYDYYNLVANGFDWETTMEGEEFYISKDGIKSIDENTGEVTLERQLPKDEDLVLRIEEVINNTLARVSVVSDAYEEFQTKFEVDTRRYFMLYQREAQFFEETKRAYFKNLQLGFIQTLTGAAYRAKVYNRLRGENESYSFVGDFEVEPIELLSDSREDRLKLVEPVGILDSRFELDEFFDSGPNSTVSFDEDELKNSLKISPQSSSSSEYEVFVDFSNPNLQQFQFFNYSEYTLSFQTQFKSDSPKDTKLKTVLSGAAFENTEREIGSIDLKNETYHYEEVSTNFFPLRSANVRQPPDSVNEDKSFRITFKVEDTEGLDWNWFLRDIRLQPAQEAGFSPDYTILKVEVDTDKYNLREIDNLQYKVDLFDIDGNKAGVFLES